MRCMIRDGGSGMTEAKGRAMEEEQKRTDAVMTRAREEYQERRTEGQELDRNINLRKRLMGQIRWVCDPSLSSSPEPGAEHICP